MRPEFYEQEMMKRRERKAEVKKKETIASKPEQPI